MEQPFARKTTVNASETTTIQRGKETNILKSRDIDTEGRWIIAIDRDTIESITKLVAGMINRLYNNAQIKMENCIATQHAPIIDNRCPACQNSLDSALLTDGNNSIQSMHSKAWGEVTAADDAGSISKKMSNKLQ
jgi:hypothetical protein